MKEYPTHVLILNNKWVLGLHDIIAMIFFFFFFHQPKCCSLLGQSFQTLLLSANLARDATSPSSKRSTGHRSQPPSCILPSSLLLFFLLPSFSSVLIWSSRRLAAPWRRIISSKQAGLATRCFPRYSLFLELPLLPSLFISISRFCVSSLLLVKILLSSFSDTFSFSSDFFLLPFPLLI